MTKIVLVETISMFRHVYAVELNDDEPNEYALDDVIDNINDSTTLEEFAQKHIDETIFSYRNITEEEYINLFDEMNDYAASWTPEQKKQYIYKKENHREVDFGPDVGKEVVE
jgi:hypothetical protein